MRERPSAGAETATGVALARAYGVCESITRERAANFYWGIRLLRAERRRAMCAVYAFARRIDDIGDGPLAVAAKLTALEEAEMSLAPLLGADTPAAAAASRADPVLVALEDVRDRFAIPPDALVQLIEGVRMDVRGATYEDFAQLVVYCRHVAGTIGRLCLEIFSGGARADERAVSLADDLGVALQLTNILRDVREDAEVGRVYVPAEDLRRFEVGDLPSALASVEEQPRAAERLTALVRFEAERAQEWFERGMRLVPLLDRRSAACVLAMAGIYRRVLRRIAEQPQRVLHERVSVPAPEKAWVAARSIAGLAR
ncbi:MAG TPA: presqualene diphosphate synthase HpnD [Solirubrobacteraceae bacterium]|nr:presqualene diphosphate synthase HpnD [Solirubrobacteraceae bacterium]